MHTISVTLTDQELAELIFYFEEIGTDYRSKRSIIKLALECFREGWGKKDIELSETHESYLQHRGFKKWNS